MLILFFGNCIFYQRIIVTISGNSMPLLLDQFVELNRRFLNVEDISENNDSEMMYYWRRTRGIDDRPSWDDLIKSKLVVILGEPGSGKTKEFENQFTIRKKDSSSFYLPLNQLIDSKLEDVFSVDDLIRFNDWQNSPKEAWFFLDSVDEAKFRSQDDFARAIDNFSRGIKKEKWNAIHVLLSSRISEWRKYEDRKQLLKSFYQIWETRKIDHSNNTTNFTQQDQLNSDQVISNELNNEKDEEKNFKVVQILPLDKEQVFTFATNVGLKNPGDFIRAVEERDALEFVKRPLDAIDIFNYWDTHGELVALKKMIEFSLQKQLTETHSRQRNDILDIEKARSGAECLAAASQLTGILNFIIPDDPQTHEKEYINADECLPDDWLPKQRDRLLDRRIFTIAFYGLIKFHHRRFQEYLAASWLSKRIDNGQQYYKIENMLFVESNGKIIIPNNYKPIVAWLATENKIWSGRLRNKILESSPELFLNNGDVESLPKEYKLQLLKKILEKYSERGRSYLRPDNVSLKRLSDQHLEQFISIKILDNEVPEDLRILLISIVRYGKLQSCQAALLDLIKSPNESDDLKSYAAMAIRDIHEESILIQLYEIIKDWDYIEPFVCGIFCEALYPQVIDGKKLIRLLRKTKDVLDETLGLPYYLEKHLEVVLDHSLSILLLKELLVIIKEEPLLPIQDKQSLVSEKYYWIGELIPIILRKLSDTENFNEKDITLVAEAIFILQYLWNAGKLHSIYTQDWQELKITNAIIKRAYFWYDFERRNPAIIDLSTSEKFVYDRGLLIQLTKEDIKWLAEDILSMQNNVYVKTAFFASLDILIYNICEKKYYRIIRKSISKNVELKKIFNSSTKSSVKLRLMRLRNRLLYRLFACYSIRDLQRKLKMFFQRFYRGIYDNLWLLVHSKQLKNGKYFGSLRALSYEAAVNHSNYGGIDIEILKQKRGKIITDSAVEGWKNVYLNWVPPLPFEKENVNSTHYGTIIGLRWIGLAIKRNELKIGDIEKEEAEKLCRYAISELNGFSDWIVDLAKYHSNVLQNTFIDCLRHEWDLPADQVHPEGVLRTIYYSNNELAPFIEKEILNLLQQNDPKNHQILSMALSVLFFNPNPPQQMISEIAVARLSSYNLDDYFYITWMVILLQTDTKTALTILKKLTIDLSDNMNLIVKLCSALNGRSARHSNQIPNPEYLKSESLKELIPFIYEMVNIEYDIDRMGSKHSASWTPNERDEAQEFRSQLLNQLAQSKEENALDVLRGLLKEEQLKNQHDYILHLIDERIENMVDVEKWLPSDIIEFMEKNEITPKNEFDLYRIACSRIEEIKSEVEKGKKDTSSRTDLHPGDDESVFRIWLKRGLHRLSRGHYIVPQEVEVDLKKRPDIRIEHPNINPTSIELKIAENHTFRKIIEGLNDQLVGKYLRASDNNCGIYVIAYVDIDKKKEWNNYNFNELVEYLQRLASEIQSKHSKLINIKVFGIDFTNPRK